MSGLFFLFGACLPFFVVGQELAPGLWTSPSIFIGIVIAALSIITRGINSRFLVLIFLILAFALTSIGRHSTGTYVPSLLILFSVLVPLCLPSVGSSGRKALSRGFMWGLSATILIVWIEIATQIAGQQSIYIVVADFFVPLEARMIDHNFFVAYFRPNAAFLEPAHLAIYLVMALFVMDLIGSQFSIRLGGTTIVTLLFVGSLVGYVLLAGYLTARFLPMLHSFPVQFKKSNFKKRSIYVIFLFILSVFLIYFYFNGVAELNVIVGRVLLVLDALQMGTLSGSEGSRVNTLQILFDYWRIEGLPGFLFGTGYGNASDWLAFNYRQLDVWATVARGSVDSIIVGIFISTGAFGGVLYLIFATVCLVRVGRDRFLGVFLFFLIINFATGFLIAYTIWHLFSVILLLSPVNQLSSHLKDPTLPLTSDHLKDILKLEKVPPNIMRN